MDYPFGQWAPDLGELSAGVLMVADGVQPLKEGYGPFKALTTTSSAGPLSAAPRGLYGYQTADETWRVVAGTSTTIELMDAAYTWSSIDTGLSITAGDDWSFERFGTKLLFTNSTQGLRVYDVEAGGAASAVAAAKDPARIFLCGNILFGLNCLDSAGTRNNRLIRSSALSDHTNWTTRGADYQPIEGGGALVWGGALSDTAALILQSGAVKLLQVGAGTGSALWGMQSVSEGFGSVGAKSVVSFNGAAYWFATDGFCKYSLGGGLEKIGAGRVDSWFLERVDQSDLSLIQGCIDPFNKNVMWRFKRSANASDTVFEDIIGYNWRFDKWFSVTVQTSYLGFGAQAPLTWDAADTLGVWDDADIAWDSRLLEGGQPLFGAMDGSYRFGYFAGENLAATLTGAVGPSKVSAMVNWAVPLDDSPDGTLALGVKDQLSDTTTWKTGAQKKASGRAPLRGRGKNIAFSRSISASSNWTYAKGIDYVSANAGGPR